MAESVQNSDVILDNSTNGYPSSDESTSTAKSLSESPGKTDTSCKDTDCKESFTDDCKPSNEDDTEIEDISEPVSDDKSDEKLQREDTYSKQSSSDTAMPSAEEETMDITISVIVSKDQTIQTICSTDDQPEATQPADKVDSHLSDHNNFADNEDSCHAKNENSSRANVSNFPEILENIRDLRMPIEVNIGKVINKRRRRRKSLAEYTKAKSPYDSLRRGKRLQRGASGGASHPQALVSSSESSQDAKVSEKVIGPTKFSSDLFSKSKSVTTEEGQNSVIAPESSGSSMDYSNTKTSDETLDQTPNIPGGSKDSGVSKGVKRKTPDSLPSTSKGFPSTSKSFPSTSRGFPSTSKGFSSSKTLPLSPLPSTPEDEAPSQYDAAYAADFTENLDGNPHAVRVNTLTSLLDRVVAFSDQMERDALYPDQDLPPHAEPVEDLERDSHRELQENFRQCCSSLTSSSTRDEDEVSDSLIESVSSLKHSSDRITDRYFSFEREMVPLSENPLTLEELNYYLPRLWEAIMSNNMILNQRTCSILDWCLQISPELDTQQFYDTEAGIRDLSLDIQNVHRSLERLWWRNRNRDMSASQLKKLTYLLSMSCTATVLFASLETEVVNIRFNLGTRNEEQSPRKKFKKDP